MLYSILTKSKQPINFGKTYMKQASWLQCRSSCLERYNLIDTIYRCPRCSSLMGVEHDLDQLKKTPATCWKKTFDSRYMKTEWPYGSGVWGKKEWIYPDLRDENIVSLYEGGTNLFWAERLGNLIGLDDFWVKNCGNSHTGSFKDLGMTVLVSAVKEKITLGGKVSAVICASTGDTSASLSAYCAAAGIPCVVILPRNKISEAQLIQPISNGAITLAVDTDFDGCMEIVHHLSKDLNFYLANSVNPLRIEGQKTLSIELVQQFDWEVPDWVIVPGGNLGNISAIGMGFKMLLDLGLIKRLPRLVCAQASNANPLYLSYKSRYKKVQSISAKETAASAIQIGNPVSIDRAINILKEFDGIVEEATEDELSNASGLADQTGLFTCPQTGVALAALMKLVRSGEIKSSDRTIVISTANGLKFTNFKLDYHRNKLPEVDASKFSSRPIEIPGDYQSVVRAIAEKI